ncbi:MAG: RibD family protein, partial [Chitinophagaceae bacterium]
RESFRINQRFFTFFKEKRPYIILKWAQSSDGYLGSGGTKRIKISSPLSDRLVHQWRGEEMGIMVGSQTALLDDPQLTTRLFPGKNPLRIILDRQLILPANLKIFNDEAETLLFNLKISDRKGNVQWIKLDAQASLIPQILAYLHEWKVLSIMVEGGGILLQKFIELDLWDEIRVITTDFPLVHGKAAPQLDGLTSMATLQMGPDQIDFYQNKRY